jgi:RNA polymerase sigma-70 factor (ECF subfamily)
MGSSNLDKWTRPPDPPASVPARAAAGDRQALGELVERYQGMVFSIASNILGQRADAEDAAQEAFLRLCRVLPQYRAQASFSTWLFRIAVTTAIDYQRRERRQPKPAEVVDMPDRSDGSPEPRVDSSTLLEALRALPDDYRLPLVLRDVYGLPYREAAELLERPLGTVRVMVHRGRNALRLRLRAAGVMGDDD